MPVVFLSDQQVEDLLDVLEILPGCCGTTEDLESLFDDLLRLYAKERDNPRILEKDI